jgi:hypothetical protein
MVEPGDRPQEVAVLLSMACPRRDWQREAHTCRRAGPPHTQHWAERVSLPPSLCSQQHTRTHLLAGLAVGRGWRALDARADATVAGEEDGGGKDAWPCGARAVERLQDGGPGVVLRWLGERGGVCVCVGGGVLVSGLSGLNPVPRTSDQTTSECGHSSKPPCNQACRDARPPGRVLPRPQAARGGLGTSTRGLGVSHQGKPEKRGAPHPIPQQKG